MSARVFSSITVVGPGVVDSAVVSARNFALGIIAAAALDLGSFGRFSTAVLVLLFAQGLSKTMHADPLVLGHAGREPSMWRRGTAAGLAATLSSSLALSLATVAGVAALGDAFAAGTSALLISTAVVLPGVVAHDLLRWSAHASGRGWLAVTSSALWAVISAGTALVVTVAPADAARLVLLWGVGAVAASVLLAVRLEVRPAVRRGLRWYADHREWCGRLGLDWLLLQVTAEGALLLVAAITTASEIGGLRKAQLPLAPIIVLTTGLIVFLQPALSRARRAGQDDERLRRVCRRVAAVAGALAMGWGVLLLLVPSAWMDRLVGGDWDLARPYLAPLTIALVCGAAGGALGIGLRVLGSLSTQVRVRLVIAPLSIGLTAAAASTAGALAATWAIALGSLVVTAAWAVLLGRAASYPATGKHSAVVS